jgi:hypothetical protein
MKLPSAPERALARLTAMLTIAAGRRYFWSRIPSDEDLLVEELMAELGVPDAAPALADHMPIILSAFSIRCASRAVREQDPNYLRSGFEAQRLASAKCDDPSEIVGSLCVLYDAADRMGVGSDFVPSSMAGDASSIAKALRILTAHPRSSTTLGDWGMAALSEADGIRYAPRGQRPPE